MKSNAWPTSPLSTIDGHGFAWINYTVWFLALHWSPIDVKAFP